MAVSRTGQFVHKRVGRIDVLLKHWNTEDLFMRHTALLVAAGFLDFLCRSATAEDWQHYSIIPVSAPTLALESVESGTTAGTTVSIGRLTKGPNQKWKLVPGEDGAF